MQTGNYWIQITEDSVDVECNTPLYSSKSPLPKSPTLTGGFFILVALIELYFACFGHGSNPSIWEILTDSRPGSAGYVSNAIVAVLSMALGIFLLAVGIRYLLPFCERLHCDRSTLTWSRIPWVSFGHRWVSRSIPLSEIVCASYAIVHHSESYYGVLLDTDGKQWKMFWGIESPEANHILYGLKGLGVYVPRDPKIRESIRETLRDRRAQL